MLSYPLEGNKKGFNKFLDFNKSGIYKLVNLINNKIYIGSAVNLRQRFKMHKRDILKNKHCNTYLSRSISKYGIENFMFEVIEFPDKENLIQREQYYIDTLKPEYNLCKIAGSAFGRICKPETREQISKSNTGKKHSKETREKMRDSRIGKYLGENHWNSKKILQLDLNDNVINTFGSIAEASRNTGFVRTTINACVNGKIKISKGYKWKEVSIG